MNARTRLAASLLTLAAVGCSSSSDAPSDIAPAPTPTVDAPPAPPAAPTPTTPPSSVDAGNDSAPASAGSPFAIVDELFYTSASVFQFKLTDYAMGCALQQQSNTNKMNSNYWKIEIDAPGKTTIPPGTYALNTASNGVTLIVLGVHHRDATCTEIDTNATTGSVTITSASSTSIVGSIDADFPGSGHVHVPLSASFCDTSVSTGAKACVP